MQRRPSRRRSKKVRRFCPLLLEALEDRRMLATIAWDNETGNGLWKDPFNWNPNSLPGPADDVVIDRPGVSLVVVTPDIAVAVQSLSLGASSQAQQKLTVLTSQFGVLRDIAIGGSGLLETFASVGVRTTDLTNSGELSVAAGTSVTVTGSFRQASSASKLTVGLRDPGVFGTVSVGGNATFGGTLDLRQEATFHPSPGVSLRIVTYHDRQGSFATLLGDTTPEGFRLAPDYRPADLSLNVVQPSLYDLRTDQAAVIS